MTSQAEALQTLEALRQLERTRKANYVWSREELATVAPFYKGSPKRFNISLYIYLYIERTPSLREKASSSNSRMNLVQDDIISLDSAIRTVFHAICPHPVRYYDAKGAINFDEYNADLGIWLTTVSSIWIQMQDTRHNDQCECCINFRMLATNYKEMFQRSMSESEYFEKRVAKNAIRRWASGISSDGAKEGLESLVQIGKSLLLQAENKDVSDLSDYVSESSEAEDNEEHEADSASEKQMKNVQLDDSEHVDVDKASPISKRRRVASKSPKAVTEVMDKDGILTLAITSLGKIVQVKIPEESYTEVGRNEICELAKTFLKQLIKVKAVIDVHKMCGISNMTRQAEKWDSEYRTAARSQWDRGK